MGNILSDPEYELRTYARQTRVRIYKLERNIKMQEARIFAARESANDASDAALLIILQRGLEKLKSERVRAYAVLNKIEMGIDAHTENEVLHDVKSMVRDIESNRETEERLGEVSDSEIDGMMRDMAGAAVYALPHAPTSFPDPPSSSSPHTE
jgi:hypothetical protein